MTQHGIVLLIVGPLVPSLMATFGIRESMAGLLLASGSIGFIVGPLFAGAVIDRASVRASLLVGFGLEMVVLAVFGLAPVFVVAAGANFFMHLGSSFIETAANVMPTLVPQKRKAHAVMNLVHMFFSVGAFVGPLLIGAYLQATAEWRPLFFFTLIPTGILLVWTLLTRFPRRQVPRPESGLSQLRSVLRLPEALWGAVTLFLYVGAEVGVSSWVVHYLQRRLSFEPAPAAAGLSILWVFVMVGRFANSRLGERFSSRTLVTVSGLAGAGAVVAFLFATTALPVYLLLAVIGLCLAGVFPNVMGELNNRYPDRIGTVTAVMAMGAAAGAALFQWFVGFLAETLSLRAAFLVPAILQVLFVVTFLAALRKPKS